MIYDPINNEFNMPHIKPRVQTIKGSTWTASEEFKNMDFKEQKHWFTKNWSSNKLTQPVKGRDILYFAFMTPLWIACILATCLLIFGAVLWALPIITKFVFWLKDLI